MWLLLAFTMQTLMIVTVAPVQFALATSNKANAIVSAVIPTLVQLAGWPTTLVAIVQASSAAERGLKKTLAVGVHVLLAVAVFSTIMFAAAAVSLHACAAGDPAYCMSPLFFADATFNAWLLVNMLVQIFALSVFTYWTTDRTASPSAVSAANRPAPPVRGTVFLLVVASLVMFTWLLYMFPMFRSLHAFTEFGLTLPVFMTVVFLFYLGTGARVSRPSLLVTTLLLVGLPFVLQFILMAVRSYHLSECTRRASDCLYGVYAVDVAMLLSNLILLIILGLAPIAVYRSRKWV
jgi:hypothetical protein